MRRHKELPQASRARRLAHRARAGSSTIGSAPDLTRRPPPARRRRQAAGVQGVRIAMAERAEGARPGRKACATGRRFCGSCCRWRASMAGSSRRWPQSPRPAPASAKPCQTPCRSEDLELPSWRRRLKRVPTGLGIIVRQTSNAYRIPRRRPSRLRDPKLNPRLRLQLCQQLLAPKRRHNSLAAARVAGPRPGGQAAWNRPPAFAGRTGMKVVHRLEYNGEIARSGVRLRTPRRCVSSQSVSNTRLSFIRPLTRQHQSGRPGVRIGLTNRNGMASAAK